MSLIRAVMSPGKKIVSGECGEGVFFCAGVTSCSDWLVYSGGNSNLLLVCLEVIIMGDNYNR